MEKGVLITDYTKGSKFPRTEKYSFIVNYRFIERYFNLPTNKSCSFIIKVSNLEEGYVEVLLYLR